MDSNKDSPPTATGGSSGLFDFSGTGDQSVSDIWTVPSGKAGSTRPQWLSDHDNQPSPAVPRRTFGSQALKRRSGANEMIKKSLAVLDEVVSTPSHPLHTHTPAPLRTPAPLHAHTPGSLLKESFRGNKATPLSLGATPTIQTPRASISIMDESGLTRELMLTTFNHGPEDTAVDQSFLNTTLFGSSRPDHPVEDPVENASYDLVSAFHRCYSVHSSPGEILELVGELKQACDDQIQTIKRTATGSSLVQTELLLERSTWELISVLYTDRLETQEESMDTITLSGRSQREIADEYFLRESTVRQAQLVVDWLENNAVSNMESYPVKVNYFADTVCWENTIHSLKRDTQEPGIVTEMDPDAPGRQGRHLAELDEKDEQSLLKHLFTCVRAGQVAKAQELCVKCGQSWRAASLEGWKLHHDPNYGKNMYNDSLEEVEGNMSRDLWKVSAWELAKDTNFSDHERALYAALSGNIKQILPVCNSWLDCVWAYFKVMVDVLTEQRLRGFSPSTGHSLETLPAEYWNATLVPELIFQEIESSHSSVIVKQSQSPFHVVHKFVILGNLQGLITVMHGWLQDKPNLYQLRFMTHLVLFSQGLGQVSTEDDKSNEIVQAYVKELTNQRFNKFVALYTSRLTHQLQVHCYADLLEAVEDPEDQRECLELGNSVGLDIPLITKSVVEHMRNIGTDDAVCGSGPELVPQAETEITKVDRSKIEVIRWLIYDKGQRSEAIRQGNALMRQFLAIRKLSAANALFNKLPSDSEEVVVKAWALKAGDTPLPAELANDIHEYRCIQAYLECQASFNDWFRHFHHNKPEAPPEPSGDGFKDNVAYEHKLKQYQAEDQTWRTQLASITEEAENRLYGLLLFGESGWMVDPQKVDPIDERRARQMVLLREICIPQTTFLLHTVLDSTEQTRKSLQLADIVASEQHKLYKVFRPHELEHLLSLLHKTVTFDLKDRQTEFGYPL